MKPYFFLFLFSLSLLADSTKKEFSSVAAFRKSIWQDVDGKTKSLSSVIDNKGLVIISYTECKTLCPTITSVVKSLFEKLETKGKQYEVIFISIDPTADTLENRKKHFEKFSIQSPNWHFLRTDLKNTKVVAKSLGFSFGEKRNNEHMMHSSQLALVDSTGKILKKIDLATDDVESLIKEF